MHYPYDSEYIGLAEEVMQIIQDILSNKLIPYDSYLQKKAKDILLKLDKDSCLDKQLVEAIEDCLIDILSCDAASWDTTPQAFNDDLSALSKLVKEIKKKHNPSI